MNALAPAARVRCLQALGVTPLQLRVPRAAAPEPDVPVTVATPAPISAPSAASATDVPVPAAIVRLALQPDPAELRNPALGKLFTALSEAVSKAGLQPVRVCDVAADPGAAVMVFGLAPLPADVPAVRVLRADPLAVLAADRERKRRLWEQMQALGRGGSR